MAVAPVKPRVICVGHSWSIAYIQISERPAPGYLFSLVEFSNALEAMPKFAGNPPDTIRLSPFDVFLLGVDSPLQIDIASVPQITPFISVRVSVFAQCMTTFFNTVW